MKLESRRIAACVLAYCRRHHDAVGPLFELLSILDAPTAVDFSFVLDAYREEFAKGFTAEEKTKVSLVHPGPLACACQEGCVHLQGLTCMQLLFLQATKYQGVWDLWTL